MAHVRPFRRGRTSLLPMRKQCEEWWREGEPPTAVWLRADARPTIRITEAWTEKRKRDPGAFDYEIIGYVQVQELSSRLNSHEP